MTDPMNDLRQASANASGVELADHFADANKMVPTQRQLLQLAAEFWPEGCEPTQAVRYARAVLARWGNHPGSPDSSAQPS
jgi:hypothetical protein